ncbi:MAG TPA: hypothetical protein VGJ62_13675 [Gemmatimonadaceae bacterium]
MRRTLLLDVHAERRQLSRDVIGYLRVFSRSDRMGTSRNPCCHARPDENSAGEAEGGTDGGVTRSGNKTIKQDNEPEHRTGTQPRFALARAVIASAGSVVIMRRTPRPW